MKEYRHYMCDSGHQWILYKDGNDPALDSDCHCTEGHQAVTMMRSPALNDVQITFRPAGRIVDSVTGQVYGKGKYYIVITNMDGNQEEISKKIYSWEEAFKAAKIFDNQSFEMALKMWQKKVF